MYIGSALFMALRNEGLRQGLPLQVLECLKGTTISVEENHLLIRGPVVEVFGMIAGDTVAPTMTIGVEWWDGEETSLLNFVWQNRAMVFVGEEAA